jgi:hypothetical protein
MRLWLESRGMVNLFGPQVDCTITLELLLSSVGRGVVPRREAGVTLRDSPTMMSDFVLPRPSRYLVAAGTHDPTVVRCEQLRCSLTQWQAQSLPPGVFDQCLLFLHMRGSRCLSTLTVRVYSIEPGPIIVTRRTGNWLAEDEDRDISAR